MIEGNVGSEPPDTTRGLAAYVRHFHYLSYYQHFGWRRASNGADIWLAGREYWCRLPTPTEE